MPSFNQLLAAVGFSLLSIGLSSAQELPGVTDKEIRLGQTMPYSGSGSHYSTIGKAAAAYFEMINDQGGISGRKVKLISLDDAYSPPKTVEQTRKLVEKDEVLLMFGTLGTATNSAVQKYLNAKKVPQLFLSSGATRFANPSEYPWTMGFQPNYQLEGRIFASYILENHPNGKIAILYQNDDLGRDYIKGLRDRLGAQADKMILKELNYNISDPTVESQVVTLHATGADILVNFSTAKFAAQSIRKVFELGWKPIQMLSAVSASTAVLKQVGSDATTGVLALQYMRDPSDPLLANYEGYKEWLAWMQKYYPSGDTTDEFNVLGYSIAQTLVQVLRQCGNDLSRENVMRQAQSLDMQLPMILPGIPLKTSMTDYSPLKNMQMSKFNGDSWRPVGPVMSGN